MQKVNLLFFKIQNSCSKALHGTLRIKLYDATSTFIEPSQVGGRRGCGTDFAVHIARQFQRWCQLQGYSCALVFLDLRSAFYKVLRCLVAKAWNYEEGLPWILSTCGVSATEAGDVMDTVRQASALAQSGCSQHLERLIASLHEGTWFAMRGSQRVYKTCRGTVPGRPLADLAVSLSGTGPMV